MTGVRAPEACQRCDGHGWIELTHMVAPPWSAGTWRGWCPDCTCTICNRPGGVIDGVCGTCFDEAELHFVRVSDR